MPPVWLLYIFCNGTADKFSRTISADLIDVCFELAICSVHLTKTCKNFIIAFIEVFCDVVLDVLYHGLSFGRTNAGRH